MIGYYYTTETGRIVF